MDKALLKLFITELKKEVISKQFADDLGKKISRSAIKLWFYTVVATTLSPYVAFMVMTHIGEKEKGFKKNSQQYIIL